MNNTGQTKSSTTKVFRIESMNTHNGPGLRTVVYIKGCPLNCRWCHNPESISSAKEIWIYNSKCLGCLDCVSVCPNSALSQGKNGIEIDRSACVGCYACADACPGKAIEKIGEDFSQNTIFEKVLEDKVFMDTSGGGLTITGGEPGVYPGFVSSLFKKCRDAGIHTAFDTSGFISSEAVEMILPYTDLVFFDLKVMDEEKAVDLTGQGTKQIFKTLDKIIEYKKTNPGPELQFRTPIIPGSTDNDENMQAIASLLRGKYQGLFTEWELNLFNDICEEKYERLDREWLYTGIKLEQPAYKKIEKFRDDNHDLKIKIAGFYEKD